ncbi:MAG: Zn-dependent hydrolase [Flavobacteriales bacterium]|nr:Zn-dependent hydrolase [Flavobacteriales bacterium]
MKLIFSSLFVLSLLLCGCSGGNHGSSSSNELKSTLDAKRAGIYTPVKLTSDLSQLTDEEKKVLKLLIQAADVMNDIFWKEAYGNKNELLDAIDDKDARNFAEMNYGPWDRLDGNKPFIEGIGEKPKGAGFYPADMTKEEFEKWNNDLKEKPYTIITRDTTGQLKATWYHEFFKEEVTKAAGLLRQAAAITSDKEFAYYLENRAEALERDSYNASDVAWLLQTGNTLDIIIGPIENYEDALFEMKCAHEAYVLIRDKEWSARLEKYVALLPGLQKELPCDPKYKADAVGNKSQLAAFDVVYYAGDCNAGGKTIAVNLPNDAGIQQEHGTRRSQLKNTIRAKFDKIVVPISGQLIDEDQRKHVTFDAFFGNVMFHEVAHGLGPKNVSGTKIIIADTLKEQHSALEEAKADVLGLWLITNLRAKGEISEGELMDNYVTFVVSVFRSCRFGASSAHGRANMLTFNFLKENEAFTRDSRKGTYNVDADKMKSAIDRLAGVILQLQGDGAYYKVKSFMEMQAVIKPEFQSDLDKVNNSGIPVDVVFEQGVDALGL